MSTDDQRSSSASRSKDYYPTISELVWACDHDVNKLISHLSKSSLQCLLRESLSQLKVSANNNHSMKESFSTLTALFTDFNAAVLPKIEMSIKETLTNVIEDIKPLHSGVAAINTAVAKLKHDPTNTHASIKQVSNSVHKQNNRDMQIRIDGIFEDTEKTRAENTEEENSKVIDILKHLKVNPTISNIERIGKFRKETKRPRTLPVTLQQAWDVRLILSRAKSLKDLDQKIYISKSLSTEELIIENELLKKRREMINSGIEASKLRIRSLKLYHEENLIEINTTNNE